MNLPVFKAFSATFGLVLGRFGTLVQIAWLPMLLMTGVGVWLFANLLPVFSNILALSENSRPEEVAAAIGPLGLPMLLMGVVLLVFMPMLFAGLLRYIVRGERPPGPFYLHFGGDELRVLGTYLLTVLINFGIGMVIAMLASLLHMALGGKGTAGTALADPVLESIARIIQIWIALRLSLAFPAAIGLRMVGVAPSWQLTKGNTLRFLGYWSLWYAVLFAVLIAIASPFMSVLGPFLRGFAEVSQNDAAAREFLTEAVRKLAEWAAANEQALWIGAAIYIATSTVITIFQVAAAGVAYRLIKAEGGDAAA